MVFKYNKCLIWVCITTVMVGISTSGKGVKQNPIVICSPAFSRAWRGRYVFASNYDWLIGLPASVVIV